MLVYWTSIKLKNYVFSCFKPLWSDQLIRKGVKTDNSVLLKNVSSEQVGGDSISLHLLMTTAKTLQITSPVRDDIAHTWEIMAGFLKDRSSICIYVGGPAETLTWNCAFKVGQRCYLLVVFGCGVLLLFIHSSQPRFSPGVGAGAAQRLVCCTLSTGIVSKNNTMLLNLACFCCCFCVLYYRGGEKRWILTLTICHAEKQRRNRVSSIAQQHSMRTKLWKTVLLWRDPDLFAW